MANYTPGPWFNDGSDGVFATDGDGKPKNIALAASHATYGQPYTVKEFSANASLIADAPAMIDLLVTARNALIEAKSQEGFDDGTTDDVHAFLAKHGVYWIDSYAANDARRVWIAAGKTYIHLVRGNGACLCRKVLASEGITSIDDAEVTTTVTCPGCLAYWPNVRFD
jgi:hypothetical protein